MEEDVFNSGPVPRRTDCEGTPIHSSMMQDGSSYGTSAMLTMPAACGPCDVCDPVGADLVCSAGRRMPERMARAILEELRSVDYKAAGTLQRSIDPTGRMSRDEFEGAEALARYACLRSKRRSTRRTEKCGDTKGATDGIGNGCSRECG